ncbi:SPOR domain-containing protein [Bacillus massilinigeriensis]|uniref:SPOR domain-containing protein n=1 Tax=Bacillus massilionigeriensis TaxID=1805475 RepID=UPI00096B49FB|nr:SPOR domain-containing protein [Bacillus massilionigeriensis]
MEKKQNERTITIKINGDEQPFKETIFIHHQEDDMEGGNEFQRDTLNNEIHRSNQESAVAEESVEESFDWILPDKSITDIKEYKINYSPSPKKKKSTIYPKSLKKPSKINWNSSILFSIAFAILLGTSFGLLMLKLLTNEHASNLNTKVGSNEEALVNNEGSPISSTKKAISLPTVSTFIIQAGVFSNEESAKNLQESISNKGVPSKIITKDGNSFLFVGLADSLENAKSLSSEIRELDIDVYAKKWSTGGEKTTSLNSDEQKLVKLVPDTYNMLVQAYTVGAMGDNLSSLDPLTKQMKKINQISEKKLSNKTVLGISKELKLAGEKLSQYHSSKEQNLLYEAQQHLLSILSGYHNLSHNG